MRKHFIPRRNFTILVLALLLFIGIAVGLILLFSTPKEQKNDLARIDSETYDTVFLSMFPIGNYTEESFAYWRGQTVMKADYTAPDLKTIQTYMNKIAKSGNEISFAYLGIRPEIISVTDLVSLLRQYPSVHYQIILPYPCIEYWKGLSDSELSEKLNAYQAAAETLIQENNASVYLFSKEWLICNPANYADTFSTTTDTSLTLMLNCDQDHQFVLTQENIVENFKAFTTLVEQERSSSVVYPDLSGQEIVFFGDSVIGNYNDSTSIPGVVNGLTGATVYNCGYGGNTATYIGEDITLPGIIDAFIREDLTQIPKDKQIYLGMSSYFEKTSDMDPSCFVINYGLNDYFERLPISSGDAYDTGTYAGALRTAIRTLQEHYPDSQIILMTPNYTNNTTPPKGVIESTNPLCNYVNAVLMVGKEMNVSVLDNYANLGIHKKNHGLYLADAVHPNEATRFLIGKHLSLTINGISSNP